MIRRLFLIAILFLASSGLASGPDSKDIDLGKEMPTVLKEVISDTFVLPKDTFGFHWQPQGAILWDKKMPKDASDYQVQEYIRYSTSRFWKYHNVYVGLYFAMDPEESQYIGGTLLKISLRKGTRYFARSDINAEFSDKARGELEAHGCGAYILEAIYNNGDVNCQSIARALTKELKIAFTVYTFGGTLPSTCTKATTRQAFVVFDPSAIVPEKTFIFPGKGAIDTPDSSKKSELGMLAHFKLYSLSNSWLRNIYAELTTSDDDFDAWVHEGFYGCDYDPFTIHELK